MYIKRDYSQPFFGPRKRKSYLPRLLMVYFMGLAAFLLFVYFQFDNLRLQALDVMGMAPTPTPFASSLATLGAQAWVDGRMEQAADYFHRAVEQQPDNPNYLYEYGRVMIELSVDSRDYDTPLRVAQHMIDVAPEDVRSFALQARALLNNGDSGAAIPIAMSGLQINASFAPLYATLAEAYTYEGRYQQGIRYGEQAIDLDPMDAQNYRSYAITLIFVGRNDDARVALETAVSLAPNHANIYFELANIYRALNEDELAVATYQRILVLNPRNARASLRMCQMYAKIGQYEQAEGYCDDAIEINENYSDAYRELGRMQYNRRNYEGAIDSFTSCQNFTLEQVGTVNEETGQTLISQNIECWYLRGLARYYLNICDEGWLDLSQALEYTRFMDESQQAPIREIIRTGMTEITRYCTGFAGQALPTDIPPTAIPPTPIGSFGG